MNILHTFLAAIFFLTRYSESFIMWTSPTDNTTKLTEYRWIYGHMFSHLPFNIQFDDEKEYYPPNLNITYRMVIGHHKHIEFKMDFYEFYEDAERNCSISFDKCDHLNMTGINVVGSQFPIYTDNETGMISLFGWHGRPKWTFNATLKEDWFEFHLVTDDYGEKRGFGITWDVLSDLIPAPPVLLAGGGVDRSNENTNPHHVGKTMVAVVVLMLALTVIVLLVVYRDHVIQFLRARMKNESSHSQSNQFNKQSVAKISSVPNPRAPQVTVKDIDEDAEDTDEDSDVLDIPDETLHDDIQSGVVPETFATNEDSLSYNSDPSDYPADFDDDIKHHKYHGADFDDDIKHHKYHDEERGLEE